MVSLGQWMMRKPCDRALSTIAFMRGAISATRRVAPAHQCLSHMSQMTMAILEGSQRVDFSTAPHSLVFEADAARLRGEPPVRPIRLQRLSAEAREALDDMILKLQLMLEPLGMDRDWIRRDVFDLLRIKPSLA